jgi:hypothetical protein
MKPPARIEHLYLPAGCRNGLSETDKKEEEKHRRLKAAIYNLFFHNRMVALTVPPGNGKSSKFHLLGPVGLSGNENGSVCSARNATNRLDWMVDTVALRLCLPAPAGTWGVAGAVAFHELSSWSVGRSKRNRKLRWAGLNDRHPVSTSGTTPIFHRHHPNRHCSQAASLAHLRGCPKLREPQLPEGGFPRRFSRRVRRAVKIHAEFAARTRGGIHLHPTRMLFGNPLNGG